MLINFFIIILPTLFFDEKTINITVNLRNLNAWFFFIFYVYTLSLSDVIVEIGDHNILLIPSEQ